MRAPEAPTPAQRKIINSTKEDWDDHEVFCREALAIRDKRGKTIPFLLQPAQKRLDEAFERAKSAGKPVRIIFLKARQVMVSTGTATEFFKRVAFSPGQKALIVSHEASSTQNIASYYKQLDDNYLPFRGLVPKLGVVRDNDNTLEYEGGGYIKVATANNLRTGRSFSLRYLHLSEFAFWRDAKTLMTGLMQSVPDDPDTCVVIESTANGVGGEFHRLWLQATDPTYHGEDGEWIPLFFGWWEHPEYTRPLTDRRAFQETLTREELELAQRYTLSLEQLHWRRWAIKNKCGGSIDTFRQEYPSNPDEAFLFSGRPRFSHAHLNRMPVDPTGGTVGDLQSITIGPKSLLKFFPDPDRKGAMVLYSMPKAGHQYVIGVDVAEGIDPQEDGDPDYSVASVLDRQTGEQVAKVRARMEPAPFGEYVEALSRFYNWAFVVPEANGPGIAFLEQLLRMDFPPALIYHRRPQPDEQFAAGDSTVLQRLGWKTNANTRVQMISRHDQNIREFGIFIRDPHTLREHQTFVVKTNGRAEATDGTHDDEVIALALAGIGLEAAPADRTIHNAMKQRPAHVPQSTGTVKTYGKRRQTGDRGQLLRL